MSDRPTVLKYRYSYSHCEGSAGAAWTRFRGGVSA